jgi:Transposase IS4
MVRNYISNDIDFVQPTQYPISKNRVAKRPPPEPEPLPTFKPLPILNENQYGQPKLPAYINNQDPAQLFRLFWTDELMDQLVEYTNKNAELHPIAEEKDFPRRWKPTSRQELYAYLAVLIHMGLHGESTIEDYWHKDFNHGSRHIVQKYIGANRWQQIDRYFYCTKPRSEDDEDFQNTFERIEDLSEELRLALMRYYKPGIHLTVNKTIKRFTGRAPKIVNIPTKPTPKGFKIWVLANQGYILDWIFHAKGDNKGPVDLDTFWVEEGLSKTQAVVMDFLTQEDPETGQRLYQPNMHTIWLDNLFTSVKLLQELRRLGIGGAGTVRTTKTKRKELDEKKESKKEQIDRQLTDLKLLYQNQIPWGTLYTRLSEDETVIEFAWKDANMVLFMSTVSNGKYSNLY